MTTQTESRRSDRGERRDDSGEKVVYINRVSKVVKGGRRFSFSAVVVIGDGQGGVGVGMGKAKEVPEAIRKGGVIARKHMIRVPMRGSTLPHEVLARFGAAKVMLRPASAGTGIIAGGGVRAIMEAAGIHDVLTKSLGSSNPVNVVRATMEGLKALRTESAERERRREAQEAPPPPPPRPRRVEPPRPREPRPPRPEAPAEAAVPEAAAPGVQPEVMAQAATREEQLSTMPPASGQETVSREGSGAGASPAATAAQEGSSEVMAQAAVREEQLSTMPAAAEVVAATETPAPAVESAAATAGTAEGEPVSGTAEPIGGERTESVESEPGASDGQA